MKHLKQKLIAMTVMMIISAVMLSSVSFAWFTLSTNPEIKGITASASANQNLEIALVQTAGEAEGAVDTRSAAATGEAQGSITAKYYTWGNLIDLSYAFGENGFTPVLQPVKFTNTSGAVTFAYPKYGVDGRVSSFANLTGKAFANEASTTATDGVWGYSVNGTSDPYYAFSVSYWVRTNVSGNLNLSTATKRANDGEDTSSTVNSTEGDGSYIKIESYKNATDETKAAIAAYATHLRVYFVNAENETVQATVGAIDSDGKCALSIAESYTNRITALTRNTAEVVKMYVFLDGTTITNKSALLTDINDVVVNVQFANTGLTGNAMTGDNA